MEHNIPGKNTDVAKRTDDAAFIGTYEADSRKLTKRCKIYYHDKTVYISNEFHENTFIGAVNLIAGEKTFKQVVNRGMPKEVKVTPSNSFLYNHPYLITKGS